jgi:uncharacterized membrane protein
VIVAAGVPSIGFLGQNIAAALAYVTVIPAVIFLAWPRFRQVRLVRFHSWQSIFFSCSVLLAGIGLRILFSLFTLLPRFGYLLGSLCALIVALGGAILWLVLLIKALQGEIFKLPLIGHLAEKA